MFDLTSASDAAPIPTSPEKQRVYGNLRNYKSNTSIYNYNAKMNKRKRGPIVIDMNIHPSLAIKIDDKKSTRPGFELANDSFKAIKCSCSAD